MLEEDRIELEKRIARMQRESRMGSSNVQPRQSRQGAGERPVRTGSGNRSGMARTGSGNRSGMVRTGSGDRSGMARTGSGDRSGMVRTGSGDRSGRPRQDSGSRQGQRRRPTDSAHTLTPQTRRKRPEQQILQPPSVERSERPVRRDASGRPSRPEGQRKKRILSSREKELLRKKRHRKWLMQRAAVVVAALIFLVFIIMLTAKGVSAVIKPADAKADLAESTETVTEEVTEAPVATPTEAATEYPVFEEPESYSVEAMKEKGIPEELIEFYEKYPETAPYAWFYPEKSKIDYKIDLTNEVTKGTIPYFCQWDDRWGYKEYGSSFMGINGCGPTCITMVYCGLTGKTDINPYDMAIYVRDRGYYIPGSGTVWDTMNVIPAEIGLTVIDVPFSADGIRETLRAGHPIICNVGPGDFTKVGHYILLAGVDDEGKIIVHDPNSPERTAKHWDVDVLISQIRNVWGYEYNE